MGSTAIERSVWTGVFWLARWGRRIRTGVGFMQSGQIGLPQFEHETPVSRLGWR